LLKAVDGALSKDEADLYRYKVYHTALSIPKGEDFEKSFNQGVEDIRMSLVKEVKDLFPEALNRPTSPDGKPGSIEEHKRRIARLLFNLATRSSAIPAGPKPPPSDLMKNPEFIRATNVCGVKAAVRAVQEEARTLADLIQSVELERTQGRAVFGTQHERFVDRLVQRVRDTKDEITKKEISEAEANRHLIDLNKQKLRFENVSTELRQARERTAEKMKALQSLADLLHAEKILFRDSVQENQDLEKEIRSLEVPSLKVGR
jgi:hypothetical protein